MQARGGERDDRVVLDRAAVGQHVASDRGQLVGTGEIEPGLVPMSASVRRADRA